MLDKKIRNDFGFDWIRFQYIELILKHLDNTVQHIQIVEKKMNGIFHSYIITIDIGILEWGGTLRFYDSELQQGLDGRDDHIKNQ